MLALWLVFGCSEDSGDVRAPLDDVDTDTPGDDDDDDAVGDDDDDDDDDDDVPVYAPAFYPEGRTHSPVNAWVADQLTAYADANSGQTDVFMKVGASSTASTNTLHCFAEASSTDLGDHTDLQATLDWFRGGDADGDTPFDRHTLAAVSGRTASWAVDGPVQDEIAAIDPAFSIVHYGTNDMGMGSTYGNALVPFHDAMQELIELQLAEGIVPVLTGISPRHDRATADEWVHTYNAVIRGMAQQWQIPFLDLWHATAHLDDHGMSGDGLHLAGFSGGSCVLTDDGLEHGYNVRNLIALQAFDRLASVVLDDAGALDEDVETVGGTGAPADPFVVHTLPFAHAADTAMSTSSTTDVYDCDDADESGPEYHYTVTLTETTTLRAVVLDGEGVDVDVHVLDDTGHCLARAHRIAETTLGPGTYTIAVDSWHDGTEAQSGPYLLAVVDADR